MKVNSVSFPFQEINKTETRLIICQKQINTRRASGVETIVGVANGKPKDQFGLTLS